MVCLYMHFDHFELSSHGIPQAYEFDSLVWTAGLTQDDIYKIKRVKKKSVCCVIQGLAYRTYEEAFDKLGLTTLQDRRKELALKFAKKASNHQHKHQLD